MRLTVLGTGTARPAAGVAASGLLVRSGATGLLLDCGTGVAARLDHHLAAGSLSAIALTHLHADHAIDLVALRYQFPWADGPARRIPLHVPPGGRAAVEAMSEAIAERPGFIEEAFDVIEFAAIDRFVVDDLVVEVQPAQHYVPAASIAVTDPAGRRLVYAGDTGPTDALVAFARSADVLVLEATLASADEDDPRRGHLTGEEAIALAAAAGARRALIVHYPPERRADLVEAAARAGAWIDIAREGMSVVVGGGLRPVAAGRDHVPPPLAASG